MRRILLLWWVPFAVALAAVIGWETDWGEALFKPAEVSPAPVGKVVTPSLLPEYKASPEPEAYAEVVDRPLFSPTRRQAPPPPPPEPPKQVMQTGQYALTGTVQVGDKMYAFLRGTRDGKGIRAAQGDLLAGGIKLAKVEPGRVVLTQYDSEEEVRMQVSKSTRTTPGAPPPPQPGQPQPGQPGAPMPGMPVPGNPNAMMGVPGMQTPQGGVVSAQPAPQVQEVPGQQPQAVPGAPGMAPFVPGISGVPQSNPVPPRRRGAMQ
jgi:hypothetical protein